MRNPYQHLVAEYARLLTAGKKMPLGGFPPARAPKLRPAAPVALIFSPHPDDECIIGALPLRLLREARMKVINVAVTLGSKKSRRRERFLELQNACDHLGFGVMTASPGGLNHVNLEARRQNPKSWKKSVSVIAEIIHQTGPRVIFFPHEKDRHPTHIGTHFIVMDALQKQPATFNCLMIETEFWGAMEAPNLMVESSPRDVADLMTALSFHAGEVRRNPYHLRLPAWMQDNVRRGSELIGGAGSRAADFNFATLYRVRRWRRGALRAAFAGGRQISCKSKLKTLFR